jgi:hypothetical protein
MLKRRYIITRKNLKTGKEINLTNTKGKLMTFTSRRKGNNYIKGRVIEDNSFYRLDKVYV